MSFGTTIPVTGLNLGYPGQMTRLVDSIITARPVLPTTPNPIQFGQSLVIVPTAGGGDNYQSVADFIAGGGTMTAALFAGVANREVKTLLMYSTLGNGNSTTPQIGQYAQNEECEGIERGSCIVTCNVGTPISQGPVYLRIALNGAFPAGVVGGFEAAADGSNTVNLGPLGVVFRTGNIDANKSVEITLRERVAA